MRRIKVSSLAIVASCMTALLLNVAKAQSWSEQPEYPIVVRVNPDTLRSIFLGEVTHRDKVDRTILGTRSVGESHTAGDVVVDVDVPANDAGTVFVVRFNGSTQTKSVGTNGPAIIDSSTVTNFTCTRPVRFDREVGFVAAPTKVQANTKIMYDGFRSTRNGVGGRLVTRAAARRAEESREEATRLVSQIQESELQKHFDSRLDSNLAKWNSRMKFVRYAGLMSGDRSRLQIAATPSKDGLKLGIGRAGNSGQLPDLPSAAKDDPPVEIWIHGSLLGRRARTVMSVADMSSDVFTLWRANLQPVGIVQGSAPETPAA